MKKILIVFGTRPEAIKMAPLVKAFKSRKGEYNVRICVTGQHRELLDQVLNFFDIIPDYDLSLMKSKQELGQLTADIIVSMKMVLDNFHPHFLFVHGDTTTSTFAALAGFYAGVKICHVEAGLRTHNTNFPFPEEANRQLTARLAFMHFTPTTVATENLIREGISREHIFLTGNTIIDALILVNEKIEKTTHAEIEKLKQVIDANKHTILVTCHRRENFGDSFIQICSALKHIAETFDVQIIFPVHLNPNIHHSAYQIMADVKNILLIEPLDYASFIWVMKTSSFIITDSGGIQEEGAVLGKPILLMRTFTERPEVVESGQVKLVGADAKTIIAEAAKLLMAKPSVIAQAINPGPYGKGDAAQQILNIIGNYDV